LPFVLNAVSYLISYLTITAIRIPLQEPRDPPRCQQPLRRRLLDGLRWLLAEPFLRVSVIYLAAFAFVSSALVLAVIVRATSHGASSPEVGLIFAFRGVGGVAGALLAPRIQRRWLPGAVLLALGVVWATGIPVLTRTIHPLVLGSILAGLSFGIPAISTIIASYRLSLTPDRLQGQAFAAMNLVANTATSFGSLAGGFLLTTIGSTGCLLVLTAITITVVAAASTSPTLRTTSPISVSS